MKIGIMTFHWAANHGAILQAYALQSFLRKNIDGADVQIINYYPKRYDKNLGFLFRSLNPRAIYSSLLELKKERRLKPFRNTLEQTQRYYTTDELCREITDMDVLIAGSDQVWNEYFTMCGEGCPTTAYYLPFCNNAKKISYAASFGYTVMKPNVADIVEPLLKKFDSISVRENSGAQIIRNLNLSCTVVSDPTMLLNKEDYVSMAEWSNDAPHIAKYILRKPTDAVLSSINEAVKKLSNGDRVIDIEYLPIPAWLGAIKNASYLVTNSFHGVVFAIMFHTPFIFIPETGHAAGMNDRLSTLLSRLALEGAVLNDSRRIDDILNNDIDWSHVDKKREEYAEESRQFLISACNGGNDDNSH